jgi:hypothetical protein
MPALVQQLDDRARDAELALDGLVGMVAAPMLIIEGS